MRRRDNTFAVVLKPAETISELSTFANTVASAAARVPVLVHMGAGRTLVTGLMRGSGASDKALDLGEQITEIAA